MKFTHIVGIDEVGRGPVAGPVTVCACAAAADFDFAFFHGIRDSKKLSAEKREEWFQKIAAKKALGEIDFAFVSIAANEIDHKGIAVAIREALSSALLALRLDPKTTQVFLDGSLHAPVEYAFQETIIKGDEKVPIISAASIVAKVMRDSHMADQAKLYPAYGFDAHKGYGTASHMKALKKHGLSPIHRRSFLKNLENMARNG